MSSQDIICSAPQGFILAPLLFILYINDLRSVSNALGHIFANDTNLFVSDKSLRPQACNFIKKVTLTQLFSCEFCEISKNTFFHRTPLVAASVLYSVKTNLDILSHL